MEASSERLAVERWRAAFARDALTGRLARVRAILEREVDALERAVAEPSAPGFSSGPAPAVAPTPPGPAAAPVAAPKPLLAGMIEEGVLSDILQLVSANHKTGLFEIAGPKVAAMIWFQAGEVQHATAGSLVGEEAFFAALASPTGSFSFVEKTEIPAEHSISGKTQFLILEGLRRMDEEAKQPGDE